jgi:excisionase family DNA binding protein
MTATNNMASEYLTVTEAAELLGICRTTLDTWARHGQIPVYRFPGRVIRYRRDEIINWAESYRREAVRKR